MTRTQLARQELYDLAWAEPMQKLARRFGISDVRLAKVCRAAEIPVPERGYWAKLHAGKPVEKQALPPRGLGMSETVTIRENAYETGAQLTARLLTEPIPPAPVFAEPLAEVTARVRTMVKKVIVPRGFDKMHPLVARLLDEHERQQTTVVPTTYSFKPPTSRIDPSSERRRLRIMNGLFLAAQRCGCMPWVRERENRETGIRVGQQNVTFILEAVSQRPTAATTKTARSKLRLSIPEWDLETWGAKPGKSWSDAGDMSLEDLLTEITVELIAAGETQYRRGVHAQHAWFLKRRAEVEEEERRRKAEETRQQRERLAKLQQERVDRLIAIATNWRRAADLRAFVVAVQEASPNNSDGLKQWMAWALATADSIDPLLTGELRVERMQNDEATR